MDIIMIDSSLHETGIICADVDIEIGTSEARNDFEFADIMEFPAAGFYVEGTEYGGFIEWDKTSSSAEKTTLKGWTWRGLLTQDIIIPPAGHDYKIVTGDANAIIREMLSGVLGGFFTVPELPSGCTISNYQFPLYINVLDGITGMLAQNGYRLSIHADKPAGGEAVMVTAEAVQVTRIEGTANEDSPYTVDITNNRMGINHLVCMGGGELQNRQRLDLYIGSNGKVTTTKYFTGFAERTAYYDYGNVESLDELRKHGEERLLSIASSRSVQVKANGSKDAEIGDTVRASLRGEVITTPIVRKIVKIKDGVPTYEYKTKDEQ